jgi:hypothetical protein
MRLLHWWYPLRTGCLLLLLLLPLDPRRRCHLLLLLHGRGCKML